MDTTGLIEWLDELIERSIPTESYLIAATVPIRRSMHPFGGEPRREGSEVRGTRHQRSEATAWFTEAQEALGNFDPNSAVRKQWESLDREVRDRPSTLGQQKFIESARAILRTARSLLDSGRVKINASRSQEPKTQLAESHRYDVAIICALDEPELAKLLDIGDVWQELENAKSHDPTIYHSSTWVTKAEAPLNVIAASASQMGALASAVLATKIIIKYQPKIVAIVGIAAGARQAEQGFGDILAADRTFDSGSGKIVMTEAGLRLLPDPDPLKVSARILSRLRLWSRKREGLDAIRASWPGLKPNTALNLHLGPLASSSAVLTSEESVAVIVEHWRKLVGVEMEAHGVHLACRETHDPSPAFLCLKSICDFVEGKDDNWQQYAAYTAAQALYRFLVEEWENLRL